MSTTIWVQGSTAYIPVTNMKQLNNLLSQGYPIDRIEIHKYGVQGEYIEIRDFSKEIKNK